VLFVCTDGLSGFPEAIDAVFPQAGGDVVSVGGDAGALRVGAAVPG
jgi:hypothetical protein